MNAVLKGFIRNGRVEDEQIDLPEGTEVVVAPEATPRDDGPVPPEEIARVLAAMQRLQPLDIPDDVRIDLDVWERKLNQRGIDHVGRCHAVVHPLFLFTEGLAYGARKRDYIVARHFFDLVDPAYGEPGIGIQPIHVRLRNDADLGPRRTGRQFDIQPGLELLFFAPERAHLRAGITVNHWNGG